MTGIFDTGIFDVGIFDHKSDIIVPTGTIALSAFAPVITAGARGTPRGGGGGGGAGLNSVTDGGDGGAGGRGEIWVVEYEEDPSTGVTGFGIIAG